MYKDQMLLMILGIESQQEIHYAMPLRQMIYNGMRYENQRAALERSHRREGNLSGNELLSGMAKTDRLIPVLTMVVYWGEKPWDGPKTLWDMLDIPPVLGQYNIIVTVQDGGKIGAKTGVKLACKPVLAPIFTSDGHPMLLDRRIRSRRCAVLNSYIL